VNAPIIRVFGVVLLLFAVLVFFTTRWTVLERDDLRDNPRNKRALLEQERIARGAIIAADDSTLARSARRADRTYTRRYPQASRFAQKIC
jgi:peptidoglycan glycosyltransferase